MNKCLNKGYNLENCICSYEGCLRKGICCECLRYHINKNELPACMFTKDIERTYDRSIKRFMSLNRAS